jgi:hypothetical protein
MLRLEKLVKGRWIFCADVPSNDAWEAAKATGEKVRLIDEATKTVVLEFTPRVRKSVT